MDTFVSWNPRDHLDEVPYDKARLSIGFLRAQLDKLFPKLEEYWKPLFVSLGLEEPVVNYELSIESHSVPVAGGFLASYEVNSSVGYVYLDSASLSSVNKVFTNKDLKNSGEILVSYLIRRLLVSLEKAWGGGSEIRISYADSLPKSIVDFPAKAKLSVEIGSNVINLVFGIPVALVEIVNSAALELQKSKLSQKTEVSIELFGIYVQPELLIDYLRDGNVIKAPKIFTSQVSLYANGRPWARGVLKTCQDKFAVELESFVSQRPENVAGQTRISLELERMANVEDFTSYQTPGAVMLTDIKLNSPISVVVSGERIARALMGLSPENKPLLRLLSKS